MISSVASINFGLTEVERQIRHCAGKYTHTSPFINQDLIDKVEKVSQDSISSLFWNIQNSASYTGSILYGFCLAYPFFDSKLRERFLDPSLINLSFNTNSLVKEVVFCKPLNFLVKYTCLLGAYAEMILFELVGEMEQSKQFLEQKKLNEEIISKLVDTPHESLFLTLLLEGPEDKSLIEKVVDGVGYLFKPLISLRDAQEISDSIRKNLKDFTQLFPDWIEERIRFITELDYRCIVLRLTNYFATVLNTFNKIYEHKHFFSIFAATTSLVFLYRYVTNSALTDDSRKLLQKRIRAMGNFLISKNDRAEKSTPKQKYLIELVEGILQNEEALLGELMALRKMGVNYHEAKALLKPLLAASKEIMYS